MPTNPVFTPVDGAGNVIGGSAATPAVTKQFRDSVATTQASGSPTAPASGTAIATVTIPAAGLYEITAMYFLSGTVAGGDANNVQLRQNATTRLTPLPLPAVANAYPPPVVVVLNCTGSDTVSLNAVAGGTASAVYNATLVARQVG
ncbi:hypothetical protein ACJ6WD_09900 [Streptomyces sp. VTCC 41912]|uniref:hypothetical protein n=1 Tax=Streptomyces sp. VTCC 41912 TaxID=3383243 RepID=UPI0038969C3E